MPSRLYATANNWAVTIKWNSCVKSWSWKIPSIQPCANIPTFNIFMARALAILLKILQKPPICSWGAKMNPNVEFISFDGQHRDYGVKPNNINIFSVRVPTSTILCIIRKTKRIDFPKRSVYIFKTKRYLCGTPK